VVVVVVHLSGYYIPELEGLELVLDFDTIARIYLNEITTWNDSRIQDLNSPAVAAALPGKSIIVIIQSTAAGLTELFTTVLNATVPDFAEQVGVGSRVTFPVESAGTGRSVVVPTDVLTPLRTTPYSFAFWPVNEILQVRHHSSASCSAAKGLIFSLLIVTHRHNK
jgi:phosphate transport system substrate-binding protein